MKISPEEIKALASLSKLIFDDERAASFAGEFDEIIAFADGINAEVGDGGREVTAVSGETELSKLRPDCVTPSLPNEKITSGVKSENGYFPVKRVVK